MIPNKLSDLVFTKITVDKPSKEVQLTSAKYNGKQMDIEDLDRLNQNRNLITELYYYYMIN